MRLSESGALVMKNCNAINARVSGVTPCRFESSINSPVPNVTIRRNAFLGASLMICVSLPIVEAANKYNVEKSDKNKSVRQLYDA